MTEMDPDLFLDVRTWQRAAFPLATLENILSRMDLYVNKLDGAVHQQDIEAAFADCVMLLWAAADKLGYDWYDIARIVRIRLTEKMKYGPDVLFSHAFAFAYKQELEITKVQSNVGRKNIYICATNPAHQLITVDSDEGVTPFVLICGECSGRARSLLYNVDQNLVATHEWYKPNQSELNGLSVDAKEHVQNGGLLLRRIALTPPQW